VVLVCGDPEVEVERTGGNPSSDFFRPLDGEAPRWVKKIFEEERFDLRGGFEAVRVEVHERARWTAVHRVDVKRGTGDVFGDTEAAREALDEGGFADAEIAVQRERAGFGKVGGELGGDGLLCIGAGGGDAGAEFIEDVHSRKKHRDEGHSVVTRRAGQNSRCA
jgi:hypothetical protein